MLNHSKMIAMSGLFSLSVILSSCYVPAEQVLTESSSDSQVSNIKVSACIATPWSQTRSGDDVPVPICYYLFDSENKCVKMEKAELASSSVGFSVAKGSYSVYALCGVNSGYPTEANASLTEFLNIAATTDVCLGKAEVVVSKYGETKPIQVMVNHIFSKMSLSLTNVPENVSEITVQFGNLSTGFSLAGTYTGNASSAEFSLSATSDTKVWEMAETLLYPTSTAAEKMAITLKIVSDDNSTQTVQTETDILAKPGVRTRLSAQFQAMSSVNSGVQMGGSWTDESGTLDFWDNQTSGTSSNDPSSSPSSSSSTSSTSYVLKGQFENTKAIIVDIVYDDGEPTELLLMGTEIGYTGTKNATISTIKGSIPDYNGKLNTESYNLEWDIPTFDQLTKIVKDLFPDTDELNQLAQSINSNAFTLDNSSNFYVTNDGNLNAYNYATHTYNTTVKSGINYLPVATYVIKK